MAQTTTWKIHDMQRDASTGGVKTIYWECRVTDNDNADCSAVEGGKLRLTPDASASDFVAYDDLTETTVLGWVYNSLIEDDETAAEAKALGHHLRRPPGVRWPETYEQQRPQVQKPQVQAQEASFEERQKTALTENEREVVSRVIWDSLVLLHFGSPVCLKKRCREKLDF